MTAAPETVAAAAAFPETSRLRKFLVFFGWGVFALTCLIFFTVMKLPQAKIHAYATGFIASQLAPMGIQFSADEGGLEVGFGLRYEMRGVKLTQNQTNKTLKISKISASPAFLALLQGKLGANLKLEEGQGELHATLLMRGEENEISLRALNLNLGRMGLLPFLAGIEGTAELNGDVEILGNFRSLSSLSGNVRLALARIVLDQQSLSGFNIPKTSVSDGQIEVNLGGGKATVQTFRLGKPGGADDIQLNVTGDVKLGRYIDSSDMNLRGKLTLSEAMKQSLSAIDVILASFKNPDGSYGFRWTGPANASLPSPDRS